MRTSAQLDSELTRILRLLGTAERLKSELRHSWLSSGRRESVAEHSWRVALMAVLLAPLIERPLDVLKCVKMALIHDLAEAEAGDVPVFQYDSEEGRKARFAAEHLALDKILVGLSPAIADEIRVLWLDFESQASVEAQVIKALDKIEVQIQHNEGPLASWEHHEKLMVFQPRWMIKYCEMDGTLARLAGLVKMEAIAKLASAGEDVASLEKGAGEVLNGVTAARLVPGG